MPRAGSGTAGRGRETAAQPAAERAADRDAKRDLARAEAAARAAGRAAERQAARLAAQQAAAERVLAEQAAKAAAAAAADLATLAAEATTMAQELLALDGEVHPFAIGLEPDGEIALLSAEGAYDRVSDAVRVAALWSEVRDRARAGDVRAVAVACPESARIRVETEHHGGEAVVVLLTRDRRGRLETERRTAGTRRVHDWS